MALEPRVGPPEKASPYGDDYYGRPRFSKVLAQFSAEGPILDLGCGDGVFLAYMREHGRTALGIDRDAKQVSTCLRNGLDAVQADALDFLGQPGNEGRFAGIMMADLVEHFDPTAAQRLLRLCARALKPGGTLVVLTPNSRSLKMCTGGFYETTIEHHNLYAASALKEFLTSLGLDSLACGVDPDSSERLFTLRPGRLLRNMAMWAIGRVICGADWRYDHTLLIMRKPEGPEPPRDS